MALLVTRGIGNDSGGASLAASAGLGTTITGAIVDLFIKIIRCPLEITTMLRFFHDRNKCDC